jgi:hypothetical protein
MQTRSNAVTKNAELAQTLWSNLPELPQKCCKNLLRNIFYVLLREISFSWMASGT